MVTRSEALLQALEQVDNDVIGVDNRIKEAISILEHNNNEHTSMIREAAKNHGQSIEKAGDDIGSGLIVGAAMLVGGLLINTLIQTVIRNAYSNKQLIQMFDSTVYLFKRYGPISYTFVLERSYAEGTTMEERRTLLNGLIYYDIIEDNYNGDPDMLYLEPESTKIIDFYKNFGDLT